jgi:PAS domain S-box-containing protein
MKLPNPDETHLGWLGAIVGLLVIVITGIEKICKRLLQFYRWVMKPRGMRRAVQELTTASIAQAAASAEQTKATNGINATLKSMDEKFGEIIKQQLIQSAANRIVLGESSVPVWLTNEQMECVQVNRALERLFGLTHEQMLGRGWLDVIIPEQRDAVCAAFKRAYDRPDDYRYEHPYTIVRDGKWVNITARSLETVKDGTGKVIAMFGTCYPTPVAMPSKASQS